MKLLKVMVALFVAVMVAGASAQMINDFYMVPKTTVAPVIDGMLDNVWHNVFEQPQRAWMNGDAADHSDLWGFSRVMWDADNLYLFLRTQDDVNFTANPNVWENDSWEVYFDGDNSKGATYDGVNDMQIRIGSQDVLPADLDAQTYFGRDGVEFVNLLAGDGTGNYVLEIKFPMAGILLDPSAGTEFGFELQQNDADGGATARESETKWWDLTDDFSWNNPSVMGTAMLWDREVGEELDVPKIATPPVIDGVQDDVWKELPAFSINSFDNGTESPYSDEDWYGNFQVAWDDNNFYGIFNTFDETNYTAGPNPWEDDCFEIYFDGDNSKGASFDGVNDMQIRIGSEDVLIADLDAPQSVRDEVEFVNRMADDGTGAYTLEIRLPMTGIWLDPTVGTEFGFEVQGNDGDGGAIARESITKWWLEVGDLSWNTASTFGTAVLSPGTAVKERPGMAKNFALSQNYPNPFNPTTSIDFSVTHRGAVKLAVYDLTGKQVANLVNEVKNAGNYSASFDASNLPSGVYFYKLAADGKISTKKMMLLK